MSADPAHLRHAVVLGAGIAGLLTARVLAEHAERVTVVEQDTLPDRPAYRRGTPQAAHLHGLVSRGRQLVEDLLPGFTDGLIEHGAPAFDFGTDVALRNPFGWGQRMQSELYSVSGSRALIEWMIHRLVAARPGITIRQRTRAIGLLGNATRVDAVLVRDAGHRADELPAELVVDATGRGPASRRRLAELGCPPPPQQTIDPRVGYASRVYQIPAGHRASWQACYLQATLPRCPRGAALLPIEGDRWIVTLIGIGPDRPTRHEEDFLPFARSLPSPIVADTLRAAAPLGDIAVSNATSNQRRRLRPWSPQPANLILVGDAACCLNPVYAQGMTAAAMAAVLLDDCLRHGSADIARRYQRRLHAATDGCWTLATTADNGPHPSPRQRISRSYLDRVLAAGTRDARVQLAFLRVLHLLRGPNSLLAPAIAVRVLHDRQRYTYDASWSVGIS
jgi:2-polyprenyl-6-methoxyphenol hydroxylase-like FAD-dependent oxidoreductase